MIILDKALVLVEFMLQNWHPALWIPQTPEGKETMFRSSFTCLGESRVGEKAEKNTHADYDIPRRTYHQSCRKSWSKESGSTFTFSEFYATLPQHTAGAENTVME